MWLKKEKRFGSVCEYFKNHPYAAANLTLGWNKNVFSFLSLVLRFYFFSFEEGVQAVPPPPPRVTLEPLLFWI